MGKHIPFGPGHPDWENQLDLFEHGDPELADVQQPDTSQVVSSNDSEMLPRDTAGLIPCSWCVGVAGLDELQRAALGMPKRSEPEVAGEPSCLLCQGKAEIEVPLRQADGHWWDWGREVIVKAEAFKQARRKVKGSDPTPLYVEHGGYNTSVRGLN